MTPTSDAPEQLEWYKAIRYWIEWRLVQFATVLVPALPRSCELGFADFLGWLVYRIDRKGSRVARANIRVAFPKASEKEIDRIGLGSMQNFARTFLDLFWSPRLTPENYAQYFDFEDLRPEEMKGKAAIFNCIHAGNFEWMSHAIGFQGMRVNIVAQEFKNEKIGPIFDHLRQVSGHSIIHKTKAMLRLFKELKKNHPVALLTDLTLKREDPNVVIKAFGLNLRVTFVHAYLHRKVGAPIIPVSNRPLPGGRYRVTFHPPLELEEGLSEQEITQRCWDFYEAWIKETPELWMWAYKYFRERDPENPEAYPFYAR